MTEPGEAQNLAQELLLRWMGWARKQTAALPGKPDFRFYGSGYVHWGTQSNWNFAATMAVLSQFAAPPIAEEARELALAAMRVSLATHRIGKISGPDGKLWGHSWIGMLGLERALHGITLLRPHFRDEDHDSMERMLQDEANWALHEGHRGPHSGIVAGLWNSSGKNVPESNIWLGAFLWRIAQMFPEHPSADSWMDRAHDYFINGISIPNDAEDSTLIAGKEIRERHVGANYFPNFALDHHGYCNVGYMAICVSNAAILHFDCIRGKWKRPESLDHHQQEHWSVLRKMIAPDGRLLRIGGDSRVRYSYCQEYLLPALLYAADRLEDPHAMEIARQQVRWISKEAHCSPDGSLYGPRLDDLQNSNPHYYCRLESDRAVALAMFLNYLPQVTKAPEQPAADASFEASVEGRWSEPEHADILHRCPTRFASVSWNASTPVQALCLPPRRSDLAEWDRNLAPTVEFLGDSAPSLPKHRKVLQFEMQPFESGFVSSGRILEGVDIQIDEGASCTDQAVTHLAFVALPDRHSFLVLQRVTAARDRVGYIRSLKALHLNVPNDLFNDYQREVHHEEGTTRLDAPSPNTEVLDLPGNWLNIDDVLGVVLAAPDPGLRISRSEENRGGSYRSLHVEEICSSVQTVPFRTAPGQILLDTGFAALASVSAKQTREFQLRKIHSEDPDLVGLWASGMDGNAYEFFANFGEEEFELEPATGRPLSIPPGGAILLRDGVSPASEK